MRGGPARVAAVDWSGAEAESSQRRHIWVADLWPERRGQPLTLEAGRTREDIVLWLIESAAQTPNLVVGLDFAFSYPEWFVRGECGCGKVADFWEVAATEGESWMRGAKSWFWGRPGVKKPREFALQPERGFRRTDREPIPGIRRTQPKSPFQVGGAGAVGTGSLRGFPMLLALRRAGFRIWPFDAPALPHAPLVMEIYPRFFTGDCTKSSSAARAQELQRRMQRAEDEPWLREDLLAKASGSEDAFDALLSALGLWRNRGEFAHLTQAAEGDERLEGRIWLPQEP
jgi:hypothetical protein